MGLDLRKLSESLNNMTEVDNKDEDRKYTYACDACGYTVNTNEDLTTDICPNCGGTLKKHENAKEEEENPEDTEKPEEGDDLKEGSTAHSVVADGKVFYTFGKDDLDFSKLDQNADKSFTSPDGKITVGRAADLKVAYPDQFSNTDPDNQVLVAPTGDSQGVQDFLSTLGFTLGEDADPAQVDEAEDPDAPAEEQPDDNTEAPENAFKYETAKGDAFETPVELAAFVDDGSIKVLDGFIIADQDGKAINGAQLVREVPSDDDDDDDDSDDEDVVNKTEVDESVKKVNVVKELNLKERSLIRHLNRAFKAIYEDDDMSKFQTPQVVDINDATLSGQKLTLMMTVKFDDGDTQDTTITIDGFDGKSGRFTLTPEDDAVLAMKPGDTLSADASVRDEGPQDESLVIRSINYNIKAKSMNESVNSDRSIKGRA